jgi:hypothetical protein
MVDLQDQQQTLVIVGTNHHGRALLSSLGRLLKKTYMLRQTV